MLKNRYAEAYAVAKYVIWWGRMSRIGALAVGAVIFIVGISFISNGGIQSDAGVFVCIAGIFAAASGFAAGIFLSAQGQIMRAVVDVAVGVSPSTVAEKESVLALAD